LERRNLLTRCTASLGCSQLCRQYFNFFFTLFSTSFVDFHARLLVLKLSLELGLLPSQLLARGIVATTTTGAPTT
jgi:hypothetical protein